MVTPTLELLQSATDPFMREAQPVMRHAILNRPSQGTVIQQPVDGQLYI